MKLLEYLQMKYGQSEPSVMTCSEAQAFGVKWPLSDGWLKRHGNQVLDPKMADALIARLRKKAASKPPSNGTAFYYLRGAEILEQHYKKASK